MPVRFDISDRKAGEDLFRHVKPEVVVHSAAMTDVDRCESEKALAWRINVEGTLNIAENCRRHGAFLVYLSTDYVFDGTKGGYNESDALNPVNYYGLTKLKGEESVKELEAYCIARGSVVYGAVPASGKVNFALWLLERLRRGENANVVIDQWNSPTLNSSLARMVCEVVEKRLTGVFHLAGASRLSRYDFARSLAEVFNLEMGLVVPVESAKIPWVARRPRDSSLNVDKALGMLENKPLRVVSALNELKSEMG
jgi:dTDP-4-dehydrorhamnose reductase